MERKITRFLLKWKTDLIRKPLLLFGSRQIGKTFAIVDFGKKYYQNIAYFNTSHNEPLKNIFKKVRSVERLIPLLSEMSVTDIQKETTLIIFDNVEEEDIITGIKSFGYMKNQYHVIAIASSKEEIIKYRSEELQYKLMNAMDFEEFLWACQQKELSEKIRYAFENKKSCAVHAKAMSLFYEYLITGGFPEAIQAKVSNQPLAYQQSVQERIFDLYYAELTKCTNLIDIPRGVEVLDSICYQLQKDNKKFQYGLLGYGKRAKEYENVIQHLVSNQLLYRSYKIKTVKSPLSSCRELDSFKLYFIADGLLTCRLHLNKNNLLNDENIRLTLYENHIAHTLVEAGYSLYYYQSDGKAEVNFVIQNRMGKIIPIEVATKTGSKAKSLSVFMKKYTTEEAYRITENNFAIKKGVRYIPIYAIFCLNDLMY